jgi:hypothetical protein
MRLTIRIIFITVIFYTLANAWPIVNLLVGWVVEPSAIKKKFTLWKLTSNVDIVFKIRYIDRVVINLLFISEYMRFCYKCYIAYYNIVIHRIWAVLQSDWLNYSLFFNLIGWITRRISAHIRRVAKNKMAVQKLHEFCEAEKRKIFALRKIIVQGKTLKKIWQVSKIHLLHRN